jgi:Cu/Ag efflux protein CusF
MRLQFPLDRHDARHHLTIALMLSLLTCAIACQPKQAEPQSNRATATQNQADPSKQPDVKYHHGVGVITKITPQDPSIVIDHEEIKDYMAAMKMEYNVKDKSLLDSLQPGDKVDFTVEDKQGTGVISEIKKR